MPAAAPPPSPVTQLLVAYEPGDADAFQALLEQVYGELRRLAQHLMQHERPGHTLNATALVHEAYFRLIDQTQVNWQNRAHFFAVAAQAMRRILISYARKRQAAKRGGDAQKVSLTGLHLPADTDLDHLLALHEALEELARLDARQARVVECRYFGGLSIENTAFVLGVSPATVKRDWQMARLWLRRALAP